MSMDNQPTPNVDQLLKRREKLLRKIAKTDKKIELTHERLEWLECFIELEESPENAAA